MITFAVVDAKPLPGTPKVRYFAAPDCALCDKVAAAVLALMNAPRNLTFVPAIPKDNRLTVLGREVC